MRQFTRVKWLATANDPKRAKHKAPHFILTHFRLTVNGKSAQNSKAEIVQFFCKKYLTFSESVLYYNQKEGETSRNKRKVEIKMTFLTKMREKAIINEIKEKMQDTSLLKG